MGDLHDALNAEFENLPRLAARDLVRRKLADLNIHDEAVVERFADMLLADDGDDTGDGHIEFDWPEDIKISFDDADADRLQGAIDKLVEDLTDTIVRLAVKMSQDVAMIVTDPRQRGYIEGVMFARRTLDELGYVPGRISARL